MTKTGSRVSRLACRVASGACTIALAASPAAQGTDAIRVTTDFTARVVSGAGEQRRWIPAGTLIRSPSRVYAWEQGVVIADGTVGPRAPFGLEVSGLTTTVRGIKSDASLGGGFEWLIQGTDRGWLRAELFAEVMPLVWGGEAWLDVTAPGIRESHHIVPPSSYGLDRRVEKFVSFTDGLTASVNVLFTAGQTSRWTTYSRGYVRLTFVPALPPVSHTSFGGPCGATLAVTDATTSSHHDVRLAVEGAFPSAPVAVLFGGHRIDPPARCALRLEPIAAVVTVADEMGRAVVDFSLQGPLQSLPSSRRRSASVPTCSSARPLARSCSSSTDESVPGTRWQAVCRDITLPPSRRAFPSPARKPPDARRPAPPRARPSPPRATRRPERTQRAGRGVAA